jgi:hypothetical protein
MRRADHLARTGYINTPKIFANSLKEGDLLVDVGIDCGKTFNPQFSSRVTYQVKRLWSFENYSV